MGYRKLITHEHNNKESLHRALARLLIVKTWISLSGVVNPTVSIERTSPCAFQPASA